MRPGRPNPRAGPPRVSYPHCMDADTIIAGFDRVLPEQERVLEQAARNVKLALERDSAIYIAFTELQFFVLSVDFDMRVMLRALLSDPQNRLTNEKFLALTLEEADESVGRVIKKLNSAMRTLPNDSGAHLFDLASVEAAAKKFKLAMQPMRDDKSFNDTLRLIRNTVAGHFVGDEVGVQNSVIWVLTREKVARDIDGVLKSQIVGYSISTLAALNELVGDLQKSVAGS